jgi:hypothetical protein
LAFEDGFIFVTYVLDLGSLPDFIRIRDGGLNFPPTLFDLTWMTHTFSDIKLNCIFVYYFTNTFPCLLKIKYCKFLKNNIFEFWHGIALDYGLDDQGFESRRELGIFLFTTASRPALGPTQPPIKWVPGAFSLGIKQPGRETDHSPPSSAEVKNAWSYTSTHPVCLNGVELS